MDASKKNHLAPALLLISVIIFAIGFIFVNGANSKMRALSGRQTLAKSLKADLERLSTYEAAEASLMSLDSKVLLPRMPMSMAAPNRKNEERFDGDNGWIVYRHSFEWDSLPAKNALEALSVLRSSRDGWRISDFSMRALDDGSGVTLGIVLETARFAETSK